MRSKKFADRRKRDRKRRIDECCRVAERALRDLIAKEFPARPSPSFDGLLSKDDSDLGKPIWPGSNGRQ